LASNLVSLALAALILATAFGPALADPPGDLPTAQATPPAGRLLSGIRRAVSAIVAAANRGDTMHLEVRALFEDDQHRIFLDIEGETVFPVPTGLARRRVLAGRGFHIATNGCVGIDFSVQHAREIAGGRVSVGFRLDVTLLSRQLFETVTRWCGGAAGWVGAGVVGAHLVRFVDGLNVEHLAHALTASVKRLGNLLGGESVEQTQRALTPGESAPTPGQVVLMFGRLILDSGIRAGMKLSGLTLGAAVGAALWPAGGAAVGAAVGVG
jgi:hypothetical protein